MNRSSGAMPLTLFCLELQLFTDDAESSSRQDVVLVRRIHSRLLKPKVIKVDGYPKDPCMVYLPTFG